jgi:NTE family protein
MQALTARGLRYDLVVGTSAGALNGAFFASVPKDEQADRANQLVEFWRRIEAKDVYRSSILAPLFRGGMLDTSPLKKLIEANVGKDTATPFICTAVNATTGELVIAKSGRVPDIRPWILASASIPVAFPPVAIDGVRYMDGSVRQNVPIDPAVGAGATEIDVIPSFPEEKAPDFLVSVPVSILQSALVAALAWSEQASQGNMSVWSSMTNAKIRVYAPKKRLVMSPLQFDRQSIEWMLVHGAEIGAVDAPVANAGAMGIDDAGSDELTDGGVDVEI